MLSAGWKQNFTREIGQFYFHMTSFGGVDMKTSIY